MALQNGHLRISVHDGKLFKTATEIYFKADDAATVAQLRAELASIVSGFNSVTAAAIDSAELRLSVAIPAANDPAGTMLNDAIGLSYPVPSIGRQWPLVIPARAAATVSGGLPDTTEGSTLDVFADLLEGNMTGTGTTSGFYTNNNYVALGAAAEGYFPDRKLAKRLQSKLRQPGA